jgi:protein required for attachment to host cells
MTQFPRCIVAADTSRARLVVQASAIATLREMATLDYPEARLHISDMVTDQQGRSFSSVGNGNRSKMEPDVDPKSEAARRFSRQVAGAIESATRKERIGSLVIAAAPKFLGLLRDGLSAPLQRKVALELSKDLVPLTAAEILTQVNKAQA